ncbi:hypothetical protein [Bacillus subtilis]|uniref:hypothetical protein n=1 Tax=Bacillus subtilis TaxID=1423 RepID=UPI0025C93A01|nr:hypothetical protein [Bacillus subtilis]GLI90514.1 hypothetical protein ANABIO4_38660 [Bacillus subtilis]
MKTMSVVYKFDGEPAAGRRFKTVDVLGYGTETTWEVVRVLGKVGKEQHEVEAKIVRTRKESGL